MDKPDSSIASSYFSVRCWLGFHKMRLNTDSDKDRRFRKCERCGRKSGMPDFETPPMPPTLPLKITSAKHAAELFAVSDYAKSIFLPRQNLSKNDTTMERKEGCYWVKVGESPWITAEWTDCHKDTRHGVFVWMVTGFSVAMGDGNLSAIDENRIPMPSERSLGQWLERAAGEGQLTTTPGAGEAFAEQFELLYGKPGDAQCETRGVPAHQHINMIPDSVVVKSPGEAKEIHKIDTKESRLVDAIGWYQNIQWDGVSTDAFGNNIAKKTFSHFILLEITHWSDGSASWRLYDINNPPTRGRDGMIWTYDELIKLLGFALNKGAIKL